MLKIEILKFEAQDVITASIPCICNDNCDPIGTKHHVGWNEKQGDIYCPAADHDNCPRVK